MKRAYFFIITVFSLFSCASSQNSVTYEAKRKIDELRYLIKLSPEQTKKLTIVETNYLKRSNDLTESEKIQKSSLTKLNEKRTSSYKKILSREQFIKFQAIDKKLIKQVPVRF